MRGLLYSPKQCHITNLFFPIATIGIICSSPCMVLKGILSQLIDLDNGQTNFDLRVIAFDLSTHKLLFSDVLDPQH